MAKLSWQRKLYKYVNKLCSKASDMETTHAHSTRYMITREPREFHA